MFKKARKSILDDIDINERILEIGPLANPLIEDFPNHHYLDIKDTEEVMLRYKDDSNVDKEKIVPIDFVLKNSYEETFKGIEKFDSVVSSHVFEHLPNPIFFFQDISKILKDNGKLIMLVPDRRFCFDYYRENSSFADMYLVYEEGIPYTKHLIFNHISRTCSEINSKVFWEADSLLKIAQFPDKEVFKTYDVFKENLNSFDGHFWSLTDLSFLKIIYDMARFNLIPLKIKKFFPTAKFTNEFGVIFEKNEKLTYDNDEKTKYLEELFDLMQDVFKFHEDIKNEKFIKQMDKKDLIINKQLKKIDRLSKSNLKKKKKINKLLKSNLKNEKIVNKMLKSNSWKITSPLRKIKKLIK